MSHDDDPSHDWSPDKEDKQSDQLKRLMDLAEKQLAGFAREATAREVPPAAVAVSHYAGPSSHIELRMIENGFLMHYFRAERIHLRGVSVEMYSAIPIEVYVSGPEDAATQIAIAMKDAAKIAKGSKEYRAYLDRQRQAFLPGEAPPAIGVGDPESPIPDL